MNGIGEAIAQVMSHSQEEVNPQQPEDYTGKDGLLYCGVCHQKKQTRVKLFDVEKVVPVICKCRQDELKREAEEAERKHQMQVIETLRSLSLMSDKFREATFETYIRRPENEKPYRVARNYVNKFDQMYAENQ
jgi:DNA replication protein DnaC